MITVVGIGILTSAAGSLAAAQPNERRRDFVEGVLRVLVETQVLPHMARAGQPPPGKPPVPPPPHSRHREVRAAIEEFSAQSGELIAMLRQEEGVRPELRPLLGDAIAVKALTDALLRRAEGRPDPALLAEGFSGVDQRWRTLATRLEGSFAVSGACRQCVRKLNASGERVCQLLGISPQVDREEIVQVLATLTGHLRGLQDVIAGLAPRSRESQIALVELQRLQMQVNLLTATASRPCPYDEFLSQYRAVHKGWRALVGQMRSLDFREGERHIRRIDYVHRQLHELLWIQLDLDRVGLARSAALLSRNVDAACECVSLKMLLAAPNAEAVLQTARELRSLCADFSKAAAGQDSLDSLRWDFRSLDVQCQQFGACLEGWASPDLSQHLAYLDDNIQAVQGALGIRPLVDLEQAVDLAAQLDSLTDQLQHDLRERLGPASRYPPPFRRDAAAAANAVHDSAHQLHDELLRRPHSESIRKSAERLSIAWQALQEFVGKLDHRDRAVVTRHYDRLAPVMARLQMMFVY